MPTKIDTDSTLSKMHLPDTERWDDHLNGEDVPEVVSYVANALHVLRKAHPTAEWIGPADIYAVEQRGPIRVVDREGVICIVGSASLDGDFDDFQRDEIRLDRDLILGPAIGDTFDSAYFNPEWFPFHVYDPDVDGDIVQVQVEREVDGRFVQLRRAVASNFAST